MSPEQLEQEVLVHRYLYYVMSDPVISDFEYDVLERKARDVLPETSVVHGVGSSLHRDYPETIVNKALARIV